MNNKNYRKSNLKNVGTYWGHVCPKEQKGITLIALIITIIVILILVAVSVRTIMNSGLFGHAKDATSKWADEQKKEENIGDNVNQLVEEQVGKEQEEETEVKFIGTYVDYKAEEGSYTAVMDKTGVNDEIGDQTFTTENVKWRIWDIDDENIYLITEKPTNTGENDNDGRLYLYGHKGVSNGVEVLTNISSNCNSNSSYVGLVARNLNLDDIEKVALKKHETDFYKTFFFRENLLDEWKYKEYYNMIFGTESFAYYQWIATYVENDASGWGSGWATIAHTPLFGSCPEDSDFGRNSAWHKRIAVL